MSYPYTNSPIFSIISLTGWLLLSLFNLIIRRH